MFVDFDEEIAWEEQLHALSDFDARQIGDEALAHEQHPDKVLALRLGLADTPGHSGLDGRAISAGDLLLR
jgi:hypothetical protein